MLYLVALLGIAGLAVFFAVRLVGTSLEEPSYHLIEKSDDYELRLYAPYLVAETETTGDFESSGNQAFRILAGYIFGKNSSGEKMSMTAPVESSSTDGLAMKMTAPVLSAPAGGLSDSEQKFVYRFVMESKFTLETLPIPRDPRITLKEVGARLVAVKRYSGSWDEPNYRRQEAALLKAVARDGRRPIGAPHFARYNAPFTPSLMRRNEVLVEVAAPSSLASATNTVRN